MTIWQELKTRKTALFSFFILLIVGFLAIYAPILANNKPFIIYTKNRMIFSDFCDSAQGNLESIIQKLEQKQPVPPKLLDNFYYFYKETLAFLKKNTPQREKWFSALNQKFSFENKEYWKNILSDFTIIRSQEIQKRFFFPLFKTLSGLDFFFMFIPPLLLLFFLLGKKYAFFKNKTFWDKLLYALLLAFILSLAISLLKKDKFDPYRYKEMTFSFEKGEWAIFPFIPYGENENILTEVSQKPTFLLEKKVENQNFHLFGTDTNGRDVLTRMIYGARISMSVGFVSVSIYVVIGIILGALAGYYAGWIDTLISRLIEIMICFPVFFLILTVMAFLKPSIFNIMVIIGLTGWSGIARLMRGEFLRLKNQEFVLALKAMGANDRRIIFRHILPNGLHPILISASFGIAGAILTESALSFLGFGVPQPTASWGDILNNGRNDIYRSWWLTVFPGLAIFLTVTAFNLLGETLRDILDPRLRHARSLKG